MIIVSHTHTHIHTHTQTHTHIQAHIHTRTVANTHTCTHIHTCTHTHTHTRNLSNITSESGMITVLNTHLRITSAIWYVVWYDTIHSILPAVIIPTSVDKLIVIAARKSIADSNYL